MGAWRRTPPRALLLVALLAVAVFAPAPLDPDRKGKGKGRSRKAPKGAARLSRRRALAKEVPLPRGRKVYIDLEAGFGNTLRLHHDLIGAVHERVPPAARSPRAWEVYGFEASPLAQPYADAFTTWLDATSSVAGRLYNHRGEFPVLQRPRLQIPPARSDDDATRYARLFGCCAPPGCDALSERTRACMREKFGPRLANMTARARAPTAALVSKRLGVAASPNDSPLPRYTFVPAAAGTAAGWTHVALDYAGAYASGAGGRRAAERSGTRAVRTRRVDLPGWLLASFKRDDAVLLKMGDVGGGAIELMRSIISSGAAKLIDVLVWDCSGAECDALKRTVASSGGPKVLDRATWSTGQDGLTQPPEHLPADPNGAPHMHRHAAQACARLQTPIGRRAQPAQPWSPSLLKVHAFSKDETLVETYGVRRLALARLYAAVGEGCAARIYARLAADGMKIGALGLELTRGGLADRRYPGQPASALLYDDDVNFALGALVHQSDYELGNVIVPLYDKVTGEQLEDEYDLGPRYVPLGRADKDALVSTAMVMDLQACETHAEMPRRDHAQMPADAHNDTGAVCRRAGRRRSV